MAYDSGKGELFVSDGFSQVFVVSGSIASSTRATSSASTTTSTASSTSLPVSYMAIVLVQIGVILAVAGSLQRKRNVPRWST